MKHIVRPGPDLAAWSRGIIRSGLSICFITGWAIQWRFLHWILYPFSFCYPLIWPCSGMERRTRLGHGERNWKSGKGAYDRFSRQTESRFSLSVSFFIMDAIFAPGQRPRPGPWKNVWMDVGPMGEISNKNITMFKR